MFLLRSTSFFTVFLDHTVHLSDCFIIYYGRYSQFQEEYTLEQILKSPKVFDPLTKLQCW